MFNRVFNYFAEIASKANKTANSQKALEIRKKLIKGGTIGVIVSGLFVLGGFIGFITSGFSAASSMNFGFPSGIIISMIAFMLGGIGVSISATALKAGLSIVVAGFATDFLDTNEYCPKCGDIAHADEVYCNKCGHDLRASKKCTCGTQNDINDNFCKTCGKDLKQ